MKVRWSIVLLALLGVVAALSAAVLTASLNVEPIQAMVPTEPEDPAVPANREAWAGLGRWEKPFLTAFGKKDPILGWADRILQRHVPGAAGQPHRELPEANHFVQEDAGPDLAELIVDFMQGQDLPAEISVH